MLTVSNVNYDYSFKHTHPALKSSKSENSNFKQNLYNNDTVSFGSKGIHFLMEDLGIKSRQFINAGRRKIGLVLLEKLTDNYDPLKRELLRAIATRKKGTLKKLTNRYKIDLENSGLSKEEIKAEIRKVWQDGIATYNLFFKPIKRTK